MGENATQTHTEFREAGRQDGLDSDTTLVISTDHPDAPIRDAALVEHLEQDSSPPTPRFIQDEGSWKQFKWVPYPVRRIVKATAGWARGPPNPPRYHIQPLFPRVQHLPIALLDKHVPRKRHRALAVFGFLGTWLLTFALVMRESRSVIEIPEWGVPAQIGCGYTYWGSGNDCGLDGCPANCASYQVLNPRAVGDQEIIYRPFVIGGPPVEEDGPAVYRGDSYICGSAIHAGVVSNANGGCGVVKLVGMHRDFNSSDRNGIKSIGFDSYFPLSYVFEPGIQCQSHDAIWTLLAISVVFTAVYSLFVTSPALFYFPVFIILYWTVGMATDSPNNSNISSLFSLEIGRFLPAMFVAWVMYDKMGIRRTLKGLTAQVEKTILWLGAAWVGALTNYTLDFIPIQRLTPRDLEQQPGARGRPRRNRRLVRYLKFYGLVALGIIICVVLPNLRLRIHHYVLALLLLPGTSIQIRPSLLYQGLLLGLFINGIARWGFDPVLQTDYALRGDAPMDTALPVLHRPVTEGNSSITFSWDPPPGTYDGITVLVNDVERFREYFTEENVVTNVTWERKESGMMQGIEYFSLAQQPAQQPLIPPVFLAKSRQLPQLLQLPLLFYFLADLLEKLPVPLLSLALQLCLLRLVLLGHHHEGGKLFEFGESKLVVAFYNLLFGKGTGGFEGYNKSKGNKTKDNKSKGKANSCNAEANNTNVNTTFSDNDDVKNTTTEALATIVKTKLAIFNFHDTYRQLSREVFTLHAEARKGLKSADEIQAALDPLCKRIKQLREQTGNQTGDTFLNEEEKRSEKQKAALKQKQRLRVKNALLGPQRPQPCTEERHRLKQKHNEKPAVEIQII
ncbi:hypothetical protein N0V88_001084 [Collariella sp. IMI 366227]|nr:hypothetical protein N0V88_001084 [Collariella sp. IMI 366227]